MTQAAWLTLALKAGLVCGFASLTGWVALYSVLAPWWRNPVGRTLVAKTALFIPTALSLFFNLSRTDSLVAGWADAALIGLVTPVMLWRSAVWVRLHRAGRLPKDSGGDEGT